jgi:S1-C subfamily serine protease
MRVGKPLKPPPVGCRLGRVLARVHRYLQVLAGQISNHGRHRMRSRLLASPALVLIPLLASGSARADELSRTEIAVRGTRATAFVDLAGRASGSAFCVHPSGLFITNEHVVRGRETGKIEVVLDPGLSSQRALAAKVVRSDRELDLALLRVDVEDELPSLPLGTMQGVEALASVVVLGFPLGSALSRDADAYPAITVGAGDVSSLRRKDGIVDRIQLDVSVTSGSSGGPVLDAKGAVIGVVVSGIRGERGLNLAVPVSHVTRFLAAPDIEFTPPELTRATLHEQLEFKARAVSIVPGAKPLDLRLVLETAGGEPREFPMKEQDGFHVARAVPAEKGPPQSLELTVHLGTGRLSGRAKDGVFTAGGKPLRLSAVRRVEFGEKPATVLAGGDTVEGEIGGLGETTIRLGDVDLSIDLAKAMRIDVEPPAELSVVRASVVARSEGIEVGRVEVPMWIRDAVSLPAADPSSVAITPPPLGSKEVVKLLPAAFTDVCLAGGGRYLIFHLPKLERLAVFDVNQAAIVNYLPLEEDEVKFAAGLDKLVIGLPGKGVLERWSLTTFEREHAVHLPYNEPIQSVLMGHASGGPVVVNGRFLKPDTFEKLPLRNEKGEEFLLDPKGGYMVSGDGTLFGTWNTRYSPATATAYVLEGNVMKQYQAGHLGHVVPGPGGNAVFTAAGVTAPTLHRANSHDDKLGYCLPAVRGNYFLSMTTAEGGKPGGFTIHLLGEPRPISGPAAIEHHLAFDGWDREAMGPWKRVYFVPQANVIVTLPPTNDRLVLHAFDADLALEQSGVDYLLVTSQPPRRAAAGGTLEYPLVVKAQRKPVRFDLAAGPPGMQLSAEGVLAWKIPADAPADTQSVIVTITDAAGQEVFHTFDIEVAR